MLCNAALLASVLAQTVLSQAEDAALRPVVAEWKAQRPAAASPLVVATDALRYDVKGESPIRLELLRHGVDFQLAEDLIESMRARNALPVPIAAPSLAGATRIRDIHAKWIDLRTARDRSLRNFNALVSVAVPGTSGDAAVVLFNSGPQVIFDSYNGARIAFVRRGRIEWEDEIALNPFLSGYLPKFAKLTAEDVAIIRTWLDWRFPDRTQRLLLVDETEEQLFLPKPELGRALEMVPRETLLAGRGSYLRGAAALVRVSVPAFWRGTSSFQYVEVVPSGDEVVKREGMAVLERRGDAWIATNFAQNIQ
jgi:hypothetical protein